MTLGNMRENDVRSLAIRCGALWCNHEGVLDVSEYGDDLAVPREMQMEHNTHVAFIEAMERLIEEKYAGQPFLPMWLPEYAPTI